jgi:hypothetical protein
MAGVLGLSMPRVVVLTILLAASRVTAQQAPVPSSQQEFLERVVALAKAAPAPEPVGGDHVLRGRVVTVDGTPLAGVLIRATPTKNLYGNWDHHPFAAETYADVDLARSLRSTASIWLKRRAMTREATTGSDGSFLFDDLDDGNYDVRAVRDGFVFENFGDPWRRRMVVASDSKVEFTAIPTFRRTFDLRLPDGSAPDRATLHFRRVGEPNDPEQGTWTPAEPTVDLPTGDWIVIAASGSEASRIRTIESARFLSSETNVVSPPPAGSETVQIALRGVCAIEGTISTSYGAPPYTTSVVAVALDSGKEPDPSLFSARPDFRKRDEPRAQVQTGGERGATYRIDRLVPGRWYVGVFRERSEPPAATAVLELGQSVLEHDFVLPPADPKLSMRVRVFDPDGTVLPNCAFRCWYTSPGRNGEESGGGGGGGLQASRNQDGTFTWKYPAPRIRFVLFADHPRFGTCACEVPKDSREVEMRFVAPLAVKIRIPGYTADSRGRDYHVEWTRFGAADGSETSTPVGDGAIGEDDVLDVGLLQPGRYRLVITVAPVKPSGRGSTNVARATWDVTAETHELALSLPKIAPLRLSVAAGTRGWFTLAPDDAAGEENGGLQRNAEVDADGGITFEDVVPGLYVVRSPNKDSMLVEAPASGTVAFVAEAVNALRVVVRDPKGALAKAGLATGDRVVAIDGREFSGRRELDQIRQSLKGEEVTFTVQRGDKLFEVVLPPRVLIDERVAGGKFYESSR